MPTLVSALQARPYRDIIGSIIPRVGGGASPALAAFQKTTGKILDYAFAQNDVIDNLTFHIDHGFMPGENLYLHPHWGINASTMPSSNFVIDWWLRVLPRDGARTTEINITQTIALDPGTYNVDSCYVNDLLIGNSGGSGGTLLDTDLINIDDLVQAYFIATTVPAMPTASPVNSIFIFLSDLHLSSTGVGSELKDSPFNN